MVCDVREHSAWWGGMGWPAPAVVSHEPMPTTAAAKAMPLLDMALSSLAGVVTDTPGVVAPGFRRGCDARHCGPVATAGGDRDELANERDRPAQPRLHPSIPDPLSHPPRTLAAPGPEGGG